MSKSKTVKILGITLASLIVASSIVGSAARPVSAKAAAKLSGSITEASWNDAATAMKAEATAFMKQNPGTKVTILSVDSSYTKLYSELAAGVNVPDVVQTQNRDFQSFYNKYPKAWLDVTSLVKPEEKNFDPVVLPLVKVKASNKYYAVPWDVGPCALFYRKDVFKQDGINVANIKTWDDYINAGKIISKKSSGKMKVMGVDYSASSSQDVINVLYNEFGGQYYDNKGKVRLNNPTMVKTLNLLKKMVAGGMTMNLASEWNDRITAIESNQLVSFPFAVWYTGTMKTACSDQSGKWGLVPLPAYTKGGPNQANDGGSILAISSATKNAELAKAFVKFALMTNKGNEINLTAGGLFTSYKPSYKVSAYSKTDSYFSGLSIGKFFSALSPKIPAIYYGPYFTDVNNALITAYGKVFSKNANPSDALNSATATAQKALDNK